MKGTRRNKERSYRGKGLLQRKCLFTVCLLVFAESVALSNAVKFWTTYNNWSNRFGGRGNRYFGEETASNDLPGSNNVLRECHNSNNGEDNTCTSKKNTPLHPRSRARLMQPISTIIRSPKQIPECCAELCASCTTSSSNVLDIRGGHSAAKVAETVVSEAAKAAGLQMTPYGIPLNIWKVIFQIFLTALNVACWLIPLRSKKISENKLGLSLANAFSGGVFLTLAFGHLIPECVHGFHDTGTNEALPYMIVLGGYLLIFFVEKVAFDAHGLLNHEQPHGNNEKDNNDQQQPNGESNASLGTGRSAVILLGALAVHSILEMTALGLADSFGDSALLSLSIALHQPAESIALLVAFLKSGMSKDQIVKYLSVFSAMGPVGVALGMAVNEFAAPIVDAIMLATVAGTFIYVGATEVIPEEWEDQEHKWKKFIALMSGIVTIFAITQYTMTLESH